MNVVAIGESLLLVIALTIDSVVLSFAYGISKCRPKFAVVLMMNVICSAMLGAALFVGQFLGDCIPYWITQRICFFLLFVMGSYKLFLAWSRRGGVVSDTVAQVSWKEGAVLALALSLDGLGVGVGAGLAGGNIIFLMLASFVTGIAGMLLGWELGYHSRLLFSRDISWISGVCLLLLSLGVMMGM